MKEKQVLYIKITFAVLFCLAYCNFVYSQNSLYPLSFKANQGNYNDSYGEYYYHIKKEEDKYRLSTQNERYVFQEVFDTIVKNAHFIKTVKENIISIYRIQNLEKIEIPNLKQVYFIRNGLEVLTNQGAQFFDNSITKINNFPKLEVFTCGTVYSERYTLKYNKKTKKYSIKISEGSFGGIRDETILNFIDLPENIENLYFLNGKKYTSESVNNTYYSHPNLIKIVRNGKSGIYSYNLNQAIYPIKKIKKIKKKEKKIYTINPITKDTIFVAKLEIPIDIEPISFTKKGSIKLQQIIPFEYNHILQSEFNGLIYLYKNNKIGIYRNNKVIDFELFNEVTTSFYKIKKNKKKGWIDIRTFKEYYF